MFVAKELVRNDGVSQGLDRLLDAVFAAVVDTFALLTRALKCETLVQYCTVVFFCTSCGGSMYTQSQDQLLFQNRMW